MNWQDELRAEFLRDPGLRRPDPGEIHRRARAEAVMEQIEREARAAAAVGAAAQIVQWLTFDVVAALAAWSATGSVVLTAGAAVLTHVSGVVLSVARL